MYMRWLKEASTFEYPGLRLVGANLFYDKTSNDILEGDSQVRDTRLQDYDIRHRVSPLLFSSLGRNVRAFRRGVVLEL